MSEVTGRNKLNRFLRYKMRVIIGERMLIGNFLAFDRHMNIVLSNCEEYRQIRSKKNQKEIKEEKRMLGLIIVRGETIVSMSVEAPPPKKETRPLQKKTNTIGVSQPMGRGISVTGVKSGLSSNIVGIGGPSTSSMFPQNGLNSGSFQGMNFRK
ncbi:small nuclear ribonucleoprotein-associated protein b' [Anaeramoeba flamelloides]|uniref:Sm protein B n=1 Tax=Anaeramoeba flamelloides TaxID=1746091 RepID=A0AAV7ZMQ9_9EUKA|nr:small nuclear ribonucleoprotein-associated protein b' [Anaeramoeba flamelloides]KAJ6242554.1 small nuclear ribonucleoprotein-associated protein b' [Anaeramoeba flamelloides]